MQFVYIYNFMQAYSKINNKHFSYIHSFSDYWLMTSRILGEWSRSTESKTNKAVAYMVFCKEMVKYKIQRRLTKSELHSLDLIFSPL